MSFDLYEEKLKEPSDYKDKDRCLDYKKMEKICDKYNSKKK